MSSDSSTDLAAIRALRASPPGRAADGRRGKTFAAALEQFEQLLRAGEEAAPATAPLMLFYALSQAGRAILAAHGSQPWEATQHGVRVVTERERIGETRVISDGDGLFQAVARATGSAPFDGEVTLSALWGGVPRLPKVAGLGGESPAIFMVGRERREDRHFTVRDEEGTLLRDPAIFLERGNGYPSTQHAIEDSHRSGKTFHVVTVEFLPDSGADGFWDSLWRYGERRYARVPPAAGVAQVSGLLTWWLILQALSQLVRYEPAGWVAALAPDRSSLTVPIEQGLDRAGRMIPMFVRDALTGPT